MVELVGGYNSTGFAILVFGLLFGGAMLNAIPHIVSKAIGIGLFIWGGVLLLGLITFAITATLNLSEYANVFPLLFAIVLLLTVFKMVHFAPFKKKGRKGEGNEI